MQRLEELDRIFLLSWYWLSAFQGDKLELITQKATELGVNRIVPLVSENCVVKYDAKSPRLVRSGGKKSPMRQGSSAAVPFCRWWSLFRT